MTSISDDFNRANSTDLGSGWVEVTGDWSIVSNQLSPGSAGGTIILRAATAMATSDNSAQVTIAATTAASHGVWCRGSTSLSSGYLWRNDGTSWNLFSVVGGSFTSIGSYVAAAVAGDVAKVQAVGTTIKGFVNGIQRVSVTDTNVATGTSVGIRSESTSAIRFDDFTAADVISGTTLGTATEADTAQALAGTKTAALTPANETDTAQGLTGTKTATLGTATEADTGQALAGTKAATPTPATETNTTQDLAGTKTATLGTAGAVEAAQPLTGSKTATLTPATEQDTALGFTQGKSRPLTPATETNTARPIGPDTPDEVNVTVGAPYSRWDTGQPYTTWETGQPW